MSGLVSLRFLYCPSFPVSTVPTLSPPTPRSYTSGKWAVLLSRGVEPIQVRLINPEGVRGCAGSFNQAGTVETPTSPPSSCRLPASTFVCAVTFKDLSLSLSHICSSIMSNYRVWFICCANARRDMPLYSRCL